MTTVSTGVRKPGRDLSINRDGVMSASLAWDIWVDVVSELPDVYTAFASWAALNGVGDTYPGASALYITDIKIRDNDAANRWYTAEITYSNERDMTPNPLNEPSRVSFSSEFYQVPAFRDRYGEALTVSSGEYPEGLYEDAVQLNVQISKNVLTIPSWFITSQGAVNVSPFSVRGLTFPAETCRLSGVNGSDELTRNGYVFYRLTYSIAFRANGWKVEYMDRGYYRKDPSLGRVAILLDDGQIATSPVPLNGSGGVLTDPKPSNVVILRKDTKPLLDFNTLPL